MSEKKTAAEVTTGIDVTVTEAQRTKLAAMAPEVRPTEAMSGLATGLLQDLANGGVMLDGRTVAQLASAMKNNRFTGDDIVAMVEKGARRFGDAMLIEYALDPVYITPLEDWSRANGRTVQELVQDCMSLAFQGEWFYSLGFETRPLTLTVEQYRTIAQAIGKDVFFGADVVAFVKMANEAPELVESK